ncbi:33 kDa inner dynein arm light chain, axonemal [Caerostris extrusa]|uniref:33 kDa inner dynein arm light chain, axonemal n=1 Tax=Caerostris extrusa TaxID=172846 RepID=A0AAV4PEN6_CAEEX|nr:33 kDa inner dynein arm light chain, axonemal [Caerostris extrusa]
MGSIDILDVLLPPMISEKNGEYWYQCVSRTSATSSDLLRLQEQLDEELLRQGAREIGICPIRSELYDQCFEELIRQEVVACPERGRLLRMVHLETKLSLDAAVSCYESALAYGIQKRLMCCKQVAHLTTETADLLTKLSEFEDIQQDLERKVPILKEQGEAREAEKQEYFDSEEMKLKLENDSLMKQMLECVEISIEPSRT